MLPDFPVQKAFFASQLSKSIEARLRKDPLVSMIHVHHMNEGKGVDIQSPGFSDHVEMAQFDFTSEVSLEDLIREGPNAYLKQAMEVADAFIKAHHRMLISKADEVTEKSGMVLDGKGQPFSPEMLLEALERLELPFDERGQPQMPTLVMHPKLIEHVKQKMPLWEKDMDLKRRFAEVIERKRQEWVDRQNRRALVD